MHTPPLKFLCWIQGVYFLITGVWPLLSLATFEAVTGPKTDDWLVHAVAVLVLVAAAVLLGAALRGKATVDTLLVGAGSAFALMNIDLIYVSRGTISTIYGADAAAELLFLGLWAWCAPAVLKS